MKLELLIKQVEDIGEQLIWNVYGFNCNPDEAVNCLIFHPIG